MLYVLPTRHEPLADFTTTTKFQDIIKREIAYRAAFNLDADEQWNWGFLTGLGCPLISYREERVNDHEVLVNDS